MGAVSHSPTRFLRDRLSPRLERVGAASGEVPPEALLHLPGERAVVDEEVDLLVQVEGSLVEVRRAHRGEDAVDDHRLEVEHRGLVLEDLHASLEEGAERRAAGGFVAGNCRLCSSEGTITRTSTPLFTAATRSADAASSGTK